MEHSCRPTEQVLCETVAAGEWRRVSVIAGETCTVMEVSQGPDTELSYGCVRHGHKIVCEWDAAAQALGVEPAHVEKTLAAMFSGEEPVLLSDLMDRFDRAGARYTYMAWDVEGDAVLRSRHEPAC